ncbi:MAG: hypothetical protein BGP05_03970 [Rhizobiales bacterium 62-47]|nr:MAG: hypothetical protein BGP05_03970 [Rhizobiales bacterium 62-47]
MAPPPEIASSLNQGLVAEIVVDFGEAGLHDRSDGPASSLQSHGHLLLSRQWVLSCEQGGRLTGAMLQTN